MNSDMNGKLNRQTDRTDQTNRSNPSDSSDPVLAYGPYGPWITHAEPTVVANTLICLAYQATYLLDHQIKALEQQFIHEGGYSETLAAARYVERDHQRCQDDHPTNAPNCPNCGKVMVLRTARSCAHAA